MEKCQWYLFQPNAKPPLFGEYRRCPIPKTSFSDTKWRFGLRLLYSAEELLPMKVVGIRTTIMRLGCRLASLQHQLAQGFYTLSAMSTSAPDTVAPALVPAAAAAPVTQPPSPKTDRMPPYRVLLHNADEPTFEYVVMSVMEIANFTMERAYNVTNEAHESGVSLVKITHKEHAELLVEQFQARLLTATMEPAE